MFYIDSKFQLNDRVSNEVRCGVCNCNIIRSQMGIRQHLKKHVKNQLITEKTAKELEIKMWRYGNGRAYSGRR